MDAYHKKETGMDQDTVLAHHITSLVETYQAEQCTETLEREQHASDGGWDGERRRTEQMTALAGT